MSLNDETVSTLSDGVDLTEVVVDSEGNLVGPLGTIKKVAADRIRFIPTEDTKIAVTDGLGRRILLCAGESDVPVDFFLQPGDSVFVVRENGAMSPYMEITASET